ncbi:hypothetical protein CC78DRAFT_355367 [Lojkania enalia]|uniref:Uncharacterized protein n=1 Tax=Lojkania enalia TaxID=147567 RepID=A0A9P4K8I9_9PLEO|nr:hypothetical protein CC78DRAFT_355367 [Didymosphaeria enalia]
MNSVLVCILLTSNIPVHIAGFFISNCSRKRFKSLRSYFSGICSSSHGFGTRASESNSPL